MQHFLHLDGQVDARRARISDGLDECDFGEVGVVLRGQRHLDYDRHGCLQPAVAQGRGEQLGLTGNTGNAAGMRDEDQHLHFEIRTVPLPGRGLSGRYSPLVVFGRCPLDQAIRKAVS